MNNILINRETKSKLRNQSEEQTKSSGRGSIFNSFTKEGGTFRHAVIMIEIMAVMFFIIGFVIYTSLYFNSWTLFFMWVALLGSLLFILIKKETIFTFYIQTQTFLFMLAFIYLGYKFAVFLPFDKIGTMLTTTIIAACSVYVHFHFLIRKNAARLY